MPKAPSSSLPGGGRRRSQRLFATVPIIVHGVPNSKRAFQEETVTQVIQAQGALILLAAGVAIGQSLVVKNQRTQEEQECLVVHLGLEEKGKTQVAIEFTQPRPNFWRVYFPPDDWKPLDADARRKGTEQDLPASRSPVKK